jgi:glycosyltransferase 2 family protein
MQGRISKLLQVILFFGIGIGIMYYVYLSQASAYKAECAVKGIPSDHCDLLSKIIEDIAHANFGWILVSMLIFVLSNVIRALRWRMMFNAIDYYPKFYNLLGSIFINYFANLGIPRSGEVIRGTVISQYEEIPLEKALGTIVADRILDAIMFGLFLIASLFLGGSVYIAYLNKNAKLDEKISAMTAQPLLIGGLIILPLLSLLLVWKKREMLIDSPFGRKLWSIIKGFGEGLQSVKDVSNMPLFIFYTVAIWACFYIMLHVMFFAFAPTAGLGPIAALIVFVFGSLGMLIPTPGGMGAYHFLISEGLQLNGLNGVDGFTFANILFFSIQVTITIICGILALVALPLLNKK